jgi:hypothetical protein
MKMNLILDRVREPSTWAGVGVILALFGVDSEMSGALTDAGAAFAALLAIILREKK